MPCSHTRRAPCALPPPRHRPGAGAAAAVVDRRARQRPWPRRPACVASVPRRGRAPLDVRNHGVGFVVVDGERRAARRDGGLLADAHNLAPAGADEQRRQREADGREQEPLRGARRVATRAMRGYQRRAGRRRGARRRLLPGSRSERARRRLRRRPPHRGRDGSMPRAATARHPTPDRHGRCGQRQGRACERPLTAFVISGHVTAMRWSVRSASGVQRACFSRMGSISVKYCMWQGRVLVSGARGSARVRGESTRARVHSLQRFSEPGGRARRRSGTRASSEASPGRPWPCTIGGAPSGVPRQLDATSPAGRRPAAHPNGLRMAHDRFEVRRHQRRPVGRADGL